MVIHSFEQIKHICLHFSQLQNSGLLKYMLAFPFLFSSVQGIMFDDYMQATIKVGGHVLNALMIEHLILRLPYHLKYVSCLHFISSHFLAYSW